MIDDPTLSKAAVDPRYALTGTLFGHTSPNVRVLAVLGATSLRVRISAPHLAPVDRSLRRLAVGDYEVCG